MGTAQRMMMQGGGASFDPGALSGCMIQLRGSGGITLATSKVSAWADISGSGDAARIAAQGNDTLRPSFTASDSEFGDQPTVVFSAATILVTGTWSSPLPAVGTVVVVGKIAATKYAVDSLSLAAQYGVATGSLAVLRMIQPSVGTVAGTSCSSPCIIVARFNGSAGKANVNSDTAITGVNSGAGNSAAGMTIGNSATGAFADGGATIAEVLAYNRLLSDAEVIQVNAYAATRYGMVIA